MTAVWIAACLAASWGFRRRPDVAVLAIFVLWALVPAQAGQVLTGVTFFTPSMLNLHPAAYLTYTYVVVFVIAGGRSLSGQLSTLPSVLLLLVWVIGLAGGLTLLQSAQASPRGYVGNLLAGTVWFVLCAVAQQSNNQFGRWLLLTVLSVATINVIVSIVQTAVGEVWPYRQFLEMYTTDFKQGAERTSGTTDHPLVLSLMLAGSLPLVLAMRRVVVRYLLAVLLFVGLLQSGSRAGLVLGVLGFSAAFLLSGRVSSKSIALYLLTATSGIVLYAGTLGQNVTERFVNDAGSRADRESAYAYLFSHLGEYLFLGGGYGSSFALKNEQVISSSFENAYAMLIVDIGLIAAAAFVLVQLLLLYNGWRGGASPILLWSALTAMATAATFSSFAVTSASLVLVWAPIAVVLASKGAGDQDGPVGRRRSALPMHSTIRGRSSPGSSRAAGSRARPNA